MIPKTEIPYAFKWLYDISFFQYAMALFQINQFRGWRAKDCSKADRAFTGCYHVGRDFLKAKRINPDHFLRDFEILLLSLACIALLSYIAYARVIARH